MRERLSSCLRDSAIQDKRFFLATGDHGYGLFKALRDSRPNQFLNVGIMEQFLVGFAAGLVKSGFNPTIYGLCSFVPSKVVEQIKLDVCLSNRKIRIIGDGAGFAYSKLGPTHHSTEDLALVGGLPNLTIYNPANEYELQVAYDESDKVSGPNYLRIGKSDLNKTITAIPKSSLPYFTRKQTDNSLCILTTGPMLEYGQEAARELNCSHISINRLKPIHEELVDMLTIYQRIIIIEEHFEHGGLSSFLAPILHKLNRRPQVEHICLKDIFAPKCGDYNYLLSVHKLDYQSIIKRCKKFLVDSTPTHPLITESF